MEASQEKLRNIIRKLKDDRTHYRTVAEDTQWVHYSLHRVLNWKTFNLSHSFPSALLSTFSMPVAVKWYCKLQKLSPSHTLHIKYCRSELQIIQDKLEKEGISKNDIIQELEALREKHQNEMLARDHARKLSKWVGIGDGWTGGVGSIKLFNSADAEPTCVVYDFVTTNIYMTAWLSRQIAGGVCSIEAVAALDLIQLAFQFLDLAWSCV